ncbi:MAG: PIN-like domain-containing protein [Pseudomonadota bacterium]|nr:PIN-like domain-containing protein [Pseudomonadota bacterium]
MRKALEGWYPKTAEELANIWEHALFVPDANILLHCVRHPKAVREELLRLFGVLQPSLWVPYQVALEFHRNRLDVERSGVDAYDQILRDYEKTIRQARDQLRQLRAHPTIDIEREVSALDVQLADFKDRIDAARNAHPEAEIGTVVDRLTELLEDRVGERWPDAELVKIKKEGETRYAAKVPPGYLDVKKDGDEYRKYGDLIIWKDMIEKAKAEKRPIIFISDDVKEDWWWIHKGKKLGPRPELVEEFKRESDQDFHIYEFGNFIRIAAEHHPEIQKDLDAVEQSLRQDSEAKERLSKSESERNRVEQLAGLEDERDELIALLSGAPDRSAPRSPISDRASVRLRLKEIDRQLGLLGDHTSDP